MPGCMHRADAQGGQKKAPAQKPAALPATPTSPQEKPAAPAPAEDKSAPAAKASRKRAPLGTNLDGINDWSASFPFVDAMKRSREWSSTDGHSWEDQRQLLQDESGWIKQLAKGQHARTLLFWDVKQYPAGDYVVKYDGTATFDYMGATATSKKVGREVLRGDGKSNLALLIDTIPTPSAYPHPIKVLLPGGACSNDSTQFCDAKNKCGADAQCVAFEHNSEQQIFHPKFLQKLAPFSVVRFMDWMKTNESKERLWKDRPKPSDVRWRDGVPLEIMVALANRVKVDPWFNIPNGADDEYVTKFATYVRENLDPELKVYVEWSNEVWNGIFPQAEYATKEGEKLKLGQGWEAQYKYHSRRSTEVHKLWEKVFAGKMSRVVRVLGTQVANYGVAEALLNYGDTKQHVDALAVAPYFGGEYLSPEEASKWENANVDAVIKDLHARSLPRSFEAVKKHAEIAKQYKLDLIAYEGGESFAGIAGTENNEKLNKLADEVGRDPRMKQVYLDYLEGWKKAGGHLFVHFTDVAAPSKHGRWGSLEHLEQPRNQAPKYDALMTFIEKTQRWW
ncbi:MAG: hypothetical protein ABW352_13665 [Polyangiales bacterium]